MMDYLSKALKYGIVDSLSSWGAILVVVNLPSSLQRNAMVEFSKSKF